MVRPLIVCALLAIPLPVSAQNVVQNLCGPAGTGPICIGSPGNQPIEFWPDLVPRIRMQGVTFIPIADDTVTFGDATHRFKNPTFSGTLTVPLMGLGTTTPSGGDLVFGHSPTTTGTSIYMAPTYTSASGNNVYGLLYEPTINHSASNVFAFDRQGSVSAGKTVTNAYGIRIQNLNGPGAVTNNYGLRIQEQTAGTSLNYAIFTDGPLHRFNGSVQIGTVLTFSTTQPTFTSGFGGATGRTIAGTATSFSIVVGSSSTDNNGVLGMPTAAVGWVCHAFNQTAPANLVQQSASSTTSVTLTQYNTTLGTATNFAASDVVKATCTAY